MSKIPIRSDQGFNGELILETKRWGIEKDVELWMWHYCESWVDGADDWTCQMISTKGVQKCRRCGTSTPENIQIMCKLLTI